MADEANEKAKAQVKRPTAKKRELQDKKKRLANRAYRGEVRSAIRELRTGVKSGDKAKLKAALSTVFSLLDKGVKKSILKKNRANRLKSRLTAAVAKA